MIPMITPYTIDQTIVNGNAMTAIIPYVGLAVRNELSAGINFVPLDLDYRVFCFAKSNNFARYFEKTPIL
jgi:hypothetical protein